MTPTDFAAFVALCKERHGWSKSEIARQLGCGRNMVSKWMETEPPRYIALACSAILQGFPPFRGS
jgi:transcriptional regulator with XRE-family HTH domain